MFHLEVPVFECEDVVEASRNGVRRLELNAPNSYRVGGTTPPVSALRDAKSSVPAGTCIRVMIRPRGAPAGSEPDFVYSEAEFEAMKDAISRFKDSGSLDASTGDGFVFGVLAPSADTGGLLVDGVRNAQLVRLARPFGCVFHRAFDDVVGSSSGASEAWPEALRAVQRCGFDGVLTSGGPGNAGDNGAVLARVVAEATELGVEVIVGGGVRSRGVQELLAAVGPACRGTTRLWLHSSCRAESGAGRGAVGFSAGEARDLLRELRAAEHARHVGHAEATEV